MIYFLWYVAFCFLFTMLWLWRGIDDYKKEKITTIIILILVSPIVPLFVAFTWFFDLADRLFFEDE